MPTRDEVSREMAERFGWRYLERGSCMVFTNPVEGKLFDAEYCDALISLKLELIAARERIQELEKESHD